eukprot:284817247_3
MENVPPDAEGRHFFLAIAHVGLQACLSRMFPPAYSRLPQPSEALSRRTSQHLAGTAQDKRTCPILLAQIQPVAAPSQSEEKMTSADDAHLSSQTPKRFRRVCVPDIIWQIVCLREMIGLRQADQSLGKYTKHVCRLAHLFTYRAVTSWDLGQQELIPCRRFVTVVELLPTGRQKIAINNSLETCNLRFDWQAHKAPGPQLFPFSCGTEFVVSQHDIAHLIITCHVSIEDDIQLSCLGYFPVDGRRCYVFWYAEFRNNKVSSVTAFCINHSFPLATNFTCHVDNLDDISEHLETNLNSHNHEAILLYSGISSVPCQICHLILRCPLLALECACRKSRNTRISQEQKRLSRKLGEASFYQAPTFSNAFLSSSRIPPPLDTGSRMSSVASCPKRRHNTVARAAALRTGTGRECGGSQVGTTYLTLTRQGTQYNVPETFVTASSCFEEIPPHREFSLLYSRFPLQRLPVSRQGVTLAGSDNCIYSNAEHRIESLAFLSYELLVFRRFCRLASLDNCFYVAIRPTGFVVLITRADTTLTRDNYMNWAFSRAQHLRRPPLTSIRLPSAFSPSASGHKSFGVRKSQRVSSSRRCRACASLTFCSSSQMKWNGEQCAVMANRAMPSFELEACLSFMGRPEPMPSRLMASICSCGDPCVPHCYRCSYRFRPGLHLGGRGVVGAGTCYTKDIPYGGVFLQTNKKTLRIRFQVRYIASLVEVLDMSFPLGCRRIPCPSPSVRLQHEPPCYVFAWDNWRRSTFVTLFSLGVGGFKNLERHCTVPGKMKLLLVSSRVAFVPGSAYSI